MPMQPRPRAHTSGPPRPRILLSFSTGTASAAPGTARDVQSREPPGVLWSLPGLLRRMLGGRGRRLRRLGPPRLFLGRRGLRLGPRLAELGLVLVETAVLVLLPRAAMARIVAAGGARRIGHDDLLFPPVLYYATASVDGSPGATYPPRLCLSPRSETRRRTSASSPRPARRSASASSRARRTCSSRSSPWRSPGCAPRRTARSARTIRGSSPRTRPSCR